MYTLQILHIQTQYGRSFSMSRAPSVWFRYHDNFPGDIIKQSVCVPSEGATLDTYYCCMQWNAGQLGGGYCGIQDHPDGRAFIYSLWDPVHAQHPITAAFVGEGTKVQHFGGEGTGLQALNFSIGWKTDKWYTLVSKLWQKGDHTYYGFWVYGQTEKSWNHIVTMDFPYGGTQFKTTSGCFVEDWAGTGQNARRAYYRHGYKRQSVGWYPFSVATFNVVTEHPSTKYAHNYDAGTNDDYFYLASGGETKPSPGIGTSHTFNMSMPSQPQEAPIVFAIAKATPTTITWNVPVSSTPQFNYTISIPGHPKLSGTGPEVRSLSLTGCEVGDEVTVTLEDILGQISNTTVKITEDYFNCCSSVFDSVCSVS